MPVKTVNLIAPGLFRAFHPPEITSDFSENRLFQKLLAKSSYLDQISNNPLYDYHKNLPLAYYECIASDIEIKNHQSVIYAQPLNLELKTDHIVARLFETTDTDLTQLVPLLNDYYQPVGLEFVQVSSGNLCCIFSKNQKVNFTVVADVLGRNIKHFLPEGDDASYWKSLFNEVQMLLHANRSTFDKELSGLNGLWFWGEAQQPELNEWPASIAGAPDWIIGLGKTKTINTVDINSLDSTNADCVTIFDESFLMAASSGDFNLWLDRLNDFTTHILEPLYKRLMNKEVDNILIYDSPSSAYELKRFDIFRILRKTPSLKKICSIQE